MKISLLRCCCCGRCHRSPGLCLHHAHRGARFHPGYILARLGPGHSIHCSGGGVSSVLTCLGADHRLRRIRPIVCDLLAGPRPRHLRGRHAHGDPEVIRPRRQRAEMAVACGVTPRPLPRLTSQMLAFFFVWFLDTLRVEEK